MSTRYQPAPTSGNEKHHPQVNQFVGCLLGLALADALGAPVETQPPSACHVYVSNWPTPKAAAPAGIGQYTDDTQLARTLLHSIVDAQGFAGAHFAAGLTELVSSGKLVGGGKTTAGSVARLQAGTPWQQSGGARPTNGSCMRVAPAALVYAANTAGRRTFAAQQSTPTHSAAAALAASTAIAEGAALATHAARLDETHFLEHIAAATKPHLPRYGLLCEQLNDWRRQKPQDVLAALMDATYEPDFAHRPGISTHATASSLWALYCFLHQPDDYLAGVGTAIRGGGDTDTTAAMTGALIGARHGTDILPAAWLPVLHDAGAWRASDLADLATKAHALSLTLD